MVHVARRSAPGTGVVARSLQPPAAAQCLGRLVARSLCRSARNTGEALRLVRRESDKRQSASRVRFALDPPRRLPEDIQYQGEALLRIAQTRGSLLSLWSDFQARKTGSGGP